jgi:hypothetical protein
MSLIAQLFTNDFAKIYIENSELIDKILLETSRSRYQSNKRNSSNYNNVEYWTGEYKPDVFCQESTISKTYHPWHPIFGDR